MTRPKPSDPTFHKIDPQGCASGCGLLCKPDIAAFLDRAAQRIHAWINREC